MQGFNFKATQKCPKITCPESQKYVISRGGLPKHQGSKNQGGQESPVKKIHLEKAGAWARSDLQHGHWSPLYQNIFRIYR